MWDTLFHLIKENNLKWIKKKCLTKLTRKNDKGKVRLFFSFLVFKEKKRMKFINFKYMLSKAHDHLWCLVKKK